MRTKYKKAITSGVFGVVILFILMTILVYLVGSILSGDSDTGPAAVGGAMIIVIISLFFTMLMGIFSVWWTFKKNFTLKDAMEVSAISGAVTSSGICLVIFIFALLVSVYGPSPNFTLSRLFSVLNSGLSICCIFVFVVGVMLSVIGGLAYSGAIILFGPKHQKPL